MSVRIDIEALLIGLREGRSFADLALILGVAKSTVRRATRAAGAKKAERTRSPEMAALARIRLLEMIDARDAAFARAVREGIQPTREGRPCERRAASAYSRVAGLPEGARIAWRSPAALPQDWPEVRRWRRARDLVFRENLGLLSWLGVRAAARTEDFGHVAEGFLTAIDLWSPEGGGSLATYAWRWILHHVLLCHRARAAEALDAGTEV